MEIYFQDPHEPLRLFKELEEENLFLIQNAHENVLVRLSLIRCMGLSAGKQLLTRSKREPARLSLEVVTFL